MPPDTLEPSTDLSVVAPFWRSLWPALVIGSVVLAIAVGLALISYHPVVDPYVQTVLSLPGDQSRGAAIFQMNCAVCHGQNAQGEIGPSLLAVTDHRGQASLIDQVISGKTPPMPQFQPDPQSMADLLQYLNSL